MSRLKQIQSIDSMIQVINTVIENRCSLSVEDVNILNEALSKLQSLKKKKGKTNKEIQQKFVEIIVLLSQFFS